MTPQKPFMTIAEACALMRVSRPTFHKIRQQRVLREFVSGKRPRFLREDIEKLMNKGSAAKKLSNEARIEFTTFGKGTLNEIQVAPNTFDLSKIWKVDPFGVIELFCAFYSIAAEGKTVTLHLQDNYVCNLLKSLSFFIELDKLYRGRIVVDLRILTGNAADYSYPLPLTGVHARRQEGAFVEKLAQLLKEQGFSDAIGGYIGWIVGELVDNSMTHLAYNGAQTDCYILAQRYRRSDGVEFIIVGVGDPGPGIYNTLRRNPKYAHLSDERAFVMAFKQNVSSWDDTYGRGKGLTDVLTIAMGNQAPFKAQSCNMVFESDFKTGKKKVQRLKDGVTGTRLAFFLVDKEFVPISAASANTFIDEILEGL
jgi:excisionase family DNA binding protein